MKYRIVILGLFVFGLISSCKEEISTKPVEKLELKHLNWLEGVWKVEDRDVYEKWSIGESEFTGASYVVSGRDTIIMEYLKLAVENDTLFYIPTVLNQNEGRPIPFALSNKIPHHPIFKNPNHDFPQVIGYQYNGKDSIKVQLQGTSDKSSEFYLLRYE